VRWRGEVDDVYDVQTLDRYLSERYGTSVRFNAGQAAEWDAAQLREVADAFRLVSERLGSKFPKGSVTEVTFEGGVAPGSRGAVAEMVGPGRMQMKVYPKLREVAQKPSAFTQELGTTQVRQSITHEIGHRLQHMNDAASFRFQQVYDSTVKVADTGALERHLARLTKAGEDAVAAGKPDVFIRQRQAIQAQIELAQRQAAKNLETFMTDYGEGFGWREDWAEAFSAYVLNPRLMAERWPQRFRILEEAFGGG
jgi:hypothetical protein